MTNPELRWLLERRKNVLDPGDLKRRELFDQITKLLREEFSMSAPPTGSPSPGA